MVSTTPATVCPTELDRGRMGSARLLMDGKRHRRDLRPLTRPAVADLTGRGGVAPDEPSSLAGGLRV